MHLNMSYADIRTLPIRYRRWFIERLAKHFDAQNKTTKAASVIKSEKSKGVDMTNVEKFFSKFQK